MEDSKNQELKESSNSASLSKVIKHGSGTSTIGTVESDWESHLEGQENFVSLHPWNFYLACRNAKIVTVEPVIFLYMFAMWLNLPLFQQYIFNYFARRELELNNISFAFENKHVCFNRSLLEEYGENETINVVEDESNILTIYQSLANKLVSIVVAMILGPLSDRYGRRPIILLVAIGGIIQGMGGIFITHFKLSVYYFILLGGVTGLFGDFAAFFMACFAYISDVSTGKWRTVRIGIAEAMVFLAGLLSEVLGGLWFKKLKCNFVPPLVAFICCHMIIGLYTLILLPKSLSKVEREMKNKNKPSGLQRQVRGIKIFLCMVKEYPAWKLWLAVIPLLIVIINMAGPAMIGVYFFKYLNWNSMEIGGYLATYMGSRMLALLILLPILVVLKLPDPLISLIGVTFDCVMNLLTGITEVTYKLFIVTAFQGVSAVVVPPLRGILSKNVSTEDQGALFSIIASLELFGTLIAGIAFPLILPKTLEHHMRPGTVYIVMAAIGLIPIPLLIFLLIAWFKAKCTRRKLTLEAGSERSPLLSDEDKSQKICVN